MPMDSLWKSHFLSWPSRNKVSARGIVMDHVRTRGVVVSCAIFACACWSIRWPPRRGHRQMKVSLVNSRLDIDGAFHCFLRHFNGMDEKTSFFFGFWFLPPFRRCVLKNRRIGHLPIDAPKTTCKIVVPWFASPTCGGFTYWSTVVLSFPSHPAPNSATNLVLKTLAIMTS